MLDELVALEGRFQCRKLLGEGSQGRTWLATEIATNRDVAIKELRYIEDFKQLELFEREAEVLKSLDVPFVPKLYECVMPEGGTHTCYLVQEFIPHPSLSEVLKDRGAMDESTVLCIMASVAQILYALENHYTPPIIHRDIKPSNILYSDSGDVWLIDFGAVANPQKAPGGSTIAGTFGYMAPEQLQGMAGIEADYYALGATALHLLTGVSPATMESKTFALQFDDVIAQKAPETSTACRELLHILLAPRAQERPRSATELMGMIQNVREGEPPRAEHRVGWRDKVRNFFDRLRSNPEKWPTCIGHVEQCSTVFDGQKSVYVFEYHYSVDGLSFAGFIPFDDKDMVYLGAEAHPKDASVAVGECVVSYRRNDPCECVLLPQTIYLAENLSAKQEKMQADKEWFRHERTYIEDWILYWRKTNDAFEDYGYLEAMGIIFLDWMGIPAKMWYAIKKLQYGFKSVTESKNWKEFWRTSWLKPFEKDGAPDYTKAQLWLALLSKYKIMGSDAISKTIDSLEALLQCHQPSIHQEQYWKERSLALFRHARNKTSDPQNSGRVWRDFYTLLWDLVEKISEFFAILRPLPGVIFDCGHNFLLCNTTGESYRLSAELYQMDFDTLYIYIKETIQELVKDMPTPSGFVIQAKTPVKDAIQAYREMNREGDLYLVKGTTQRMAISDPRELVYLMEKHIGALRTLVAKGGPLQAFVEQIASSAS